jgi:hypothetical protein
VQFGVWSLPRRSRRSLLIRHLPASGPPHVRAYGGQPPVLADSLGALLSLAMQLRPSRVTLGGLLGWDDRGHAPLVVGECRVPGCLPPL